MYGTLTQKGQVAIPKVIRDHFGLKPKDKIRFTIQKNRIVAEKALTTESMFGVIKAKKPLTKKEMKRIIQDAVVEKFERKNYENRS